MIVTLGQWAQTHTELMLACSITLVLMLGTRHIPWRTVRRARRKGR
jgi:hypothetical protein